MQRLHIRPKALVIDGEQRQVAVVPHRQDLSARARDRLGQTKGAEMCRYASPHGVVGVGVVRAMTQVWAWVGVVRAMTQVWAWAGVVRAMTPVWAWAWFLP
jgi:DNA-binding transcriptional regulator LsrR (DeoR family)